MSAPRESRRAEIASEHEPREIRERLARTPAHGYLRDGVLGAIDGCVTTFAVVAGATGGRFSGAVVVVLGLANLIADGFSMGVSNFQGAKTEHESVARTAREEDEQIRLYPQGEREEIRQIFAQKGFEGETLERIVEVISSDRELWIETMLTEEHGLQLKPADPLRAGLVTFGAFILVGMIPLLPFLWPWRLPLEPFTLSAVSAGAVFFAIGIVRGRVLERPAIRAGVETLLMGGGAAALAFVIAALLRTMVDGLPAG